MKRTLNKPKLITTPRRGCANAVESYNRIKVLWNSITNSLDKLSTRSYSRLTSMKVRWVKDVGSLENMTNCDIASEKVVKKRKKDKQNVKLHLRHMKTDFRKIFASVISNKNPITFLFKIPKLIKDHSLYMTEQLIQLTFNDLDDLLTRLTENNGLNIFIVKTFLK